MFQYESKIDEKSKIFKNAEFSNQNLVGELKDKITLFNQIIENKDKEIKHLIETSSNREKKAKKKDAAFDDSNEKYYYTYFNLKFRCYRWKNCPYNLFNRFISRFISQK